MALDQGIFEMPAKWGHKGNWIKSPLHINAKIETAREKRTFANAWRSSRCLIPATGWYEWTGTKGEKQPWLITLEHDASDPDVPRKHPVFFFAGLYCEASDLSVKFLILTREADPLISGIHSRMPVIVREEETVAWLIGQGDEDAVIENIGTGFGAELMAHKVEPFGVKDDRPDMIKPVDTLF